MSRLQGLPSHTPRFPPFKILKGLTGYGEYGSLFIKFFYISPIWEYGLEYGWLAPSQIVFANMYAFRSTSRKVTSTDGVRTGYGMSTELSEMRAFTNTN